MRQLDGKFLLIMILILSIIVVIQTFMLHHCSNSLKTQQADIRLELFQELDSMAWEYEVHPNTKYVTGVKRYYKCDVIKKCIEQEIK